MNSSKDATVVLRDGKEIPLTKRVFAPVATKEGLTLPSGSTYVRVVTGALVNTDIKPLSKKLRAKMRKKAKNAG